MADEPKYLFALIQRRADLLGELKTVDEQIAAEMKAMEGEAVTKGLSPRRAQGTVSKMVTALARVNMSASKADDDDPLNAMANAAGFSKRSLAAEVTKRLRRKGISCSHTAIILARNGDKRIRQEIVDTIEKIIGFPAKPTNWPGGIIPADSK